MNACHSNHVSLVLLVIASLTLAIAIPLILPPSLQATPLLQYRYVAPSGADTTNDCTSSVTPCQTVQHAFDMAQDGDHILVAAGTYTGTMTQYLLAWGGNVTATVVITKNIATLAGGYSQDFATRDPNTNLTTLSAAASPGDFVVFITGTNTVVDGFKVTGSNGSNTGYGAGVRVNGGEPTISHNRIQGNTAPIWGGGIYVTNNAAPTISENVITLNTANDRGGGIYIRSGTVVITGNQVVSNTAKGEGGGIYTYPTNPVTITNNTIAYNQAITPTVSYGGGIFVRGGPVVVTNNQIHHNSVATDSGGAGIYLSGSTTTGLIQHNDILSNSGGDGGGIWPCGVGTVTVDSNLIAYNINHASWGSAVRYCSSQLVSTTLSNNVIVSNTGNGVSTMQNVNVVNNTLAGNSRSGLSVGLSVAPVVINNIASENGNCGFDGSTYGIQLLDYNDSWGNSSNYCNASPGTHSISADPQFVNVAAGDYHIRFGSPTMNTGTNAGAPSYDKDGVLRPQMGRADMGAYEIIGNSLYLPAILR